MKQDHPDTKTNTKNTRKADQYNDPTHNYLRYWDGRDYENAAEHMAIKRLLAGKHFKHAVDVGGGYGRLCVLLEKYSDAVTLAEPSQQQLDIAADFLKDHPKVDRKLMQAADLKFKNDSVDLLTIVRVLHHIPNPQAELAEIARVLSPDGHAIIEVANYAHGRNRLKYMLKGKKLPTDPVDIRSEATKKKDDIPFVNHNPQTLMRQLGNAGLKVEKVLSVSNLRSTTLKKIVPKGVMLTVESILQPALAHSFFGPSVFFLVKKG
jgi:ubiquinone/menaquinone biosynthesis C-methylase UbiE